MTRPPTDPVVLAHYYIWFDASSWGRAKRDYPLLGRYSSDEASVMRRHIELAKAAGIDGFIVSWKHTEVYDRRLAVLVNLAEQMSFKLAITYQGLDFNREPLPADRVAGDLDLFLERFAGSPAFAIFGTPLVAWTGTWAFTADDIARVTATRRGRLKILATEKDVAGYERVASAVDGNLYYWSSVNPSTHDNHRAKLAQMGDAVRSHGGLWVAPAAPGFDARLVGGVGQVERRGGATLREEWDAAVASGPDAIGLISWNEFSENTHIEPSREYGSTALRVISDLTGAPAPKGELDSDGPPGRAQAPGRLLLLGVLVLAIAASGLIARPGLRPGRRVLR